jgi:hypothetical protein
VQHLRDHRIEPEGAEECFFHDYEFSRHERRFDDVYIMDGRTDRGRKLRLVFQDKGNPACTHFYGLGFEAQEAQEEEKEMKRRFGKLTRAEQERIELEYHQMDPHQFDERMAQAKTHVVESIRLPRRMVQSLKIVAESDGKRGYKTMVTKWIEERLRQEAGK